MKRFLMLAAVAGVGAVQAMAGYQITMKTATEGDQKARRSQPAQAGMMNGTMVMSTAEEKARIDFKEGHGPGLGGEGAYLVTKDAGKTFILISPKDKTYMKWDMESMMGMAGSMGSMMKMQISDPKVEKEIDEPGEPILGYATRHYKFKTAYQMSMNVMGFKNEMTIQREEETWTTRELEISSLGAWFNKTPQTQNEELDKLIKAEKGKMSGLPLKMIAIQSTTDSQGRTTISKTLMNVTEVKKIGADAIDAEIPVSYKEMNLFAPGAGQEGDDSGKAGHHSGQPKFDINSMMRKAMQQAQ